MVNSTLLFYIYTYVIMMSHALSLHTALIPGQSGEVARTAWGSFLGRGWGQPPPGSHPSAAPDPKTAHWTSDSDHPHHRKTWRCSLTPRDEKPAQCGSAPSPHSALDLVRKSASLPDIPVDVSGVRAAKSQSSVEVWVGSAVSSAACRWDPVSLQRTDP